jgi:hypothetical protein
MSEPPRTDLEIPRSVGAILTTTWRIYRAYPLLFALLAVAVMAPFELAVLAATGHGPLWHGHESASTVVLGWLLRTSLVTPLISALHVHAVVAVGEGRTPRRLGVAVQGLRVLPVVAAAAIMAEGGILLGFLALLIPGILLSLRWAVVAQAAALEGEGWQDALRSSQRLTRTRYGHVLWLLAVTWVLAEAVRLGAWQAPLGSASGAGSVSVGIAVDTLLASFTALTLALLYFDLRARPRAEERAQREHAHLRDLDQR